MPSLPDNILPAPAPEARAHSDRCLLAIIEEIEASGWISFARFMDLALYGAGLGYYSAGATKLGSDGDFVTAPEISPLFSRALARQIGQLLAITDGEIVELGAGSGRMAYDMLLALADADRLPKRYAIVEVSATLREQQRARLRDLPLAIADRVQWLDTLPGAIDGVVIGNEVLDALPVHLVLWTGGGLMERGVALRAGQLAWSDKPLAPGDLYQRAARLRVAAPYLSEISLGGPALISSLAQALRRGALLFIDYGFGESEYYHPQRDRGTLMCHYRHRAHDDPFFLPGLQDITSHVDFTAAATAGVESGLRLAGYTTQAHFLINAGITELLLQSSPEDVQRYLPLAAQVQKLVSPAEMGELTKAIALTRGIDDELIGFRAGDKTGLL